MRVVQDDVPGLRGRTELLTPAETATADALAAASGVPGGDLMENAGRAVARAIIARLRPQSTLIACGPGNNGGDGYVVARHLQNAGWSVSIAALAPSRDGTDAARAARRWSGPMETFAPASAARAGLVVDAVFGAGLTRDVDGAARDLLLAARKIVAIDVPSGLDGETGQVRGFAPRTDLTVTFFRLKPGHLLMPGRALCGELVLADIGLPVSVLDRIAPRLWVNHPSRWALPEPAEGGHKFDRGIVTLVGGAVMTGATRLAAQAARRVGAGLVTIAACGGSASVYRSGDAGAIVTEETVATLLADKRRKVWVCGPGLGLAAARATLPDLLAAGRSVVVDADGLSCFAGAPDALAGAAVLTPHAAEFERVFGPIGNDRVAAARRAARRTGAVVLLKGADTVIAAPDGRATINASAPPWLATAGAGDVLAGLIAGLLAQGLPAEAAACAAAWLHGRAAAMAGIGMVAEDLPPLIGAARQDAATISRTAKGSG
ncbi:MAG: NAD(P)H-hydrate dehydratase [Proteobacteria bacterium]|nr:NAD(P)H-hydrate dehydratase [Pseudomonadota bacterium]